MTAYELQIEYLLSAQAGLDYIKRVEKELEANSALSQLRFIHPSSGLRLEVTTANRDVAIKKAESQGFVLI